MSLVVLDRVGLSHGVRTLFAGVDLRIGVTDRIGLVGPNGSGKSTLLRMIAGEVGTETGTIRTSRGMRVGYLPQDVPLGGGKGLLEFVMESVPGRGELTREIETTEEELASASTASAGETEMLALAERLARLHERAATFSMHFSEHEALRILAGLGFPAADRDRDLGELSGGWRMRALLAALLFQRPDLLLLDEPTNHLDMPSVAWFAAFLRAWNGAFLLVCHDREFLNEQIDRIVSFEVEGVRQYTGDFESYVAQRAEEEVILENKARNLERAKEKAELFIDRFRAQATKARAVQSKVKALGRMEDVQTYRKRKTIRFRFPPCDRAGEEVIRVQGLRKAYGSHVVFDGIDLAVRRGERIGMIGPNGSGKTTLLRILAGELAADAGEVGLGHRVTASYYAQHHAETLHPDRTAFQEVAAHDPSGSRTRVQTILGAFLFSGDDVEKLTRVLSGGERSRLALARILVAPGNLLLMDEPTNHLDLDSSDALAEALATYDGTLVFVSHNRSFVRRLATRTWDVEGGRVETYPGTLDEYLAWKLAERDPSAAPKRGGAAARAKDRDKDRKREEAEKRAERSRALRPLKVEVDRLEKEIAEVEASQKARSAELADPEIYAASGRGGPLLAQYQEEADRLSSLLAAWEKAVAKLEEAEALFEE